MHHSISLLIVSLMLPFITLAQSYDSEILSIREECFIEENGKLHNKYHFKIKINNKKGQYHGEITIPYVGKNTVHNLKAWITDINGNVVKKLKKSDISSSSYSHGSFHTDTYYKSFALRHDRYPYIIHYGYESSSTEYLEITRFYPIKNWRTTTKKAELLVSCPSTYTLKYRQNKMAPPVIKKEGERTTYTWKTSYTEILKQESFAPHNYDRIGYVQVIPENFNYYREGSYLSWDSYGNWLNSLSTHKDQLPEEEKRKILAMVTDKKDTIEIIKKLYHYLQDNTRYVNVSLGTGGMVPHDAVYVAENKYGDCKALTNYMKAMLDLMNIPSFCADIYRSDKARHIFEDFPSQQFNHVFLGIPMSNDTIWLENTSRINPFGYVETTDQHKSILIVKKDGSYVSKSPALSVNDVLEKSEYFYDLTSPNSVNMHCRYQGKKFEELNWSLQTDTKEDQREYIENHLILYKDYTLVNWDLTHPHRDSTYIVFDASIYSDQLVKNYGGEYVYRLPGLDLPQLNLPNERQSSVQIDYPIHIVQSFVFKNLEEKQLNLGTNRELKSTYGYLKIGIEQKGDLSIIKKEFKLNNGKYALAEYPEFYSFINQVKKLSSISVTFE